MYQEKWPTPSFMLDGSKVKCKNIDSFVETHTTCIVIEWLFIADHCCDIGQIDIFSRIELRVKVTLELIPSIVLSSKRLITRMTFNSFLSCLMSKESIEITINISKWHEHAKQWNGNSHISLIS